LTQWIYRNDTDHPVMWKGFVWPPEETRPVMKDSDDVPFPVPEHIGLTLVQEGNVPDPVVFADDVVVEGAGGELIVHIPAPANGDEFIDITVWCGIGDGAFLRFNGPDNTEISIDRRGLIRRMRWEDCATLYFRNPTGGEATIGISVLRAEVGSLPVTIIPGVGGGSSGGSGSDHTHSNLTALNKIAVPGAGRIMTDGVEIIGVKGLEMTVDIVLDAGQIAVKYVELPDDYATGYPVVVVLESLTQTAGVDYALVENTWPTKDRISWAGKSLDGLIKAGDRLSVTYYKKV